MKKTKFSIADLITPQSTEETLQFLAQRANLLNSLHIHPNIHTQNFANFNQNLSKNLSIKVSQHESATKNFPNLTDQKFLLQVASKNLKPKREQTSSTVLNFASSGQNFSSVSRSFSPSGAELNSNISFTAGHAASSFDNPTTELLRNRAKSQFIASKATIDHLGNRSSKKTLDNEKEEPSSSLNEATINLNGE